MRRIAPLLIAVTALWFVPGGSAQETRATPFVGDIDQLAEDNDDFRRVLHTSSHLQLVVMSIPPGESIGRETHQGREQCLFIVEGQGRAELAGRSSQITSDSVVCVPAGTEHDIVNTAREPLKLYTVYAPPQHPPRTVHRTRAEAERAERRASR